MTLAESLAQYIEERTELQNQSLELSDRLSKAKFGKRGPIRRTLRKIKRSIRRADRQIRGIQNEMRKEGKNDVQELLATQGIDGRSNQLNAIASITGEVAKGVGNAMGGGALGGLKPSGSPLNNTLPSTKSFDTRNAEQDQSKTMLYVGGGVALLGVIYMMMKKKK